MQRDTVAKTQLLFDDSLMVDITCKRQDIWQAEGDFPETRRTFIGNPAISAFC